MTDPVVQRNETPSGIVVEYEEAPRRLYRVNGVEVPSVTTVLGCLDKGGGLTWWAMTQGVSGAQALLRSDAASSILYGTPEDGVRALTSAKLTVNHIKKQAGDRGLSVHDALEEWVDGIPINLVDFPESERGYVEGLVAFLHDAQPEPVLSETMVGSVEHGYAGRFDLAARVDRPCNVVVRRDKKGKETRGLLPDGLYLLDLKTSSGVYESFHMQLEAYELAAVECGYPASDFRAVLRVAADGGYELRRSLASGADFLAAKSAYLALERIRRAEREEKAA